MNKDLDNVPKPAVDRLLSPSVAIDCVIIIVTHNSSFFLQWCLDGLSSSASKLVIRIVDSGSTDTSYLDVISSRHDLRVIRRDNIGFVAANNLAISEATVAPWILFLNPDARIDGKTLDDVLAHANSASYVGCGILTVPLVRYDIVNKKSIGTYDSVGIRSSWFGRWYDVLSGVVQSDVTRGKLDSLRTPEAVCGAFMLVRSIAFMNSLDSTGQPGFERSYFMYKEDIELSLRLKRNHWELAILPQYTADHCRGWRGERLSVPFWARAASALNDLDIALKYRWRAIPFAFLKRVWVTYFERR